jgi:hypothetical protein
MKELTPMPDDEDEDEDEDEEEPVWESYARFALIDRKPVIWLEISGDQQALINNLEPGQVVHGIEIRIPNPRAGAVCP